MGIDASQLYQYALCQPMPVELYTRWENKADLHRFKSRSNKPRSFQSMVMAFFRARVHNVKLKVFTQQEHSEQLTALVLMDFAVTVAVLKLFDAFIIYANVKKFNLD